MKQKEVAYKEVIKQIVGIIDDEPDLIANLANTVALLKAAFGFWWVGFYIVKESALVLGPFQGPVACTRIGFGKGVCGGSWQKKQTIIVEDVHKFEGHIACSTASNSEIVVPIIKKNEVVMVLDIDSTEFNYFNKTDSKYLEDICLLIAEKL